MTIALPTLACTCCRGAWAPACELFAQSGAVFLGTVLDHNDDASGRFTQWTLYLVRVDEAFRGLEPDQRELFIDPGSFTSCYTHYEIGRQYLFFAGGSLNFAAMSVVKGAGSGKPWPARWAGKKSLKAYGAAMCSGTRGAREAAEDLAWLRAHGRGETRTRVFGVTLQDCDVCYGPPRRDEELLLAGARVVLIGDGQQYVTTSAAGGRYSFEGVPAGDYRLHAERAPWISSSPESFTLAPGGCAQRDLSLESEGEIKGSLLTHQGKPARYVRVELIFLRADGKLAEEFVAASNTDEQGWFHLERVPAGEFVVGVNISSPPVDYWPYATTFHPGVQDLAAARRFRLVPHRKLGGLRLRLPPPLTSRPVRVYVYWADGTPAKGDTRAGAEYRGLSAAFEGARTRNIVDLKLFEELDYEVWAGWVTPLGHPTVA